MKTRIVARSVIALIIALVILLVLAVRSGREGSTAEGLLIFALDTRLPDHTFAGIRDGVRIGTGRGIWGQSLEATSKQAELFQPCRQKPWCASTDSTTHIVFGCGTEGTLYEIRTARRLRLKIPTGEQLIALSLRGNYALLVSEKTALLRNYKIAGGHIFWTSRQILPDVPPPQSIFFAPTGTAILMESGGWTYLLPALGQKARKVIKGCAIGWMPDGQHFLVYDERAGELVRHTVEIGKSDVMRISKYFEESESPVAVSPSGEYILSLVTRFDWKRFLPEVKVFRIRKIEEPWRLLDVDAGWGVGKVYWLPKWERMGTHRVKLQE